MGVNDDGAPPPTVTVAIPTYNRSASLLRAIRSVQAQTFEDWELIVHDNASTDDTTEVLAGVMAADPRIRHHRHPENIGHWRNQTGAMHSGHGRYVALMWDDDEWLADNLARKVAVLDAHPSVVCVHSAFEQVDETGARIGTLVQWDVAPGDLVIEPGAAFIAKSYRSPCRVLVMTAVLRRSALLGLGLFEADAPADDHMLWLRVAARGDVAYLREPLCRKEINQGISSGSAYQEVIDGFLTPTLRSVAGAEKVMRSFLHERPVPLRERVRLQVARRAWVHSTLAHMVTVRYPGLRPRRDAIRYVRDVVRYDPSVLVDPRFAARVSRAAVRGARTSPSATSPAS
jgi:glycosyltransferase involved in cell wall biosynthesis